MVNHTPRKKEEAKTQFPQPEEASNYVNWESGSDEFGDEEKVNKQNWKLFWTWFNSLDSSSSL